jgi:TetR/AcrR family transcriptional regulator, transcriptional repressor for nem operon
MMAQSSTREEIIRKGADLIHAQGFNATGIQQILNAAGIPKGSFYFYFKSKEDFGLTVIDYFTSTFGEIFRRYLADKKIPPLRRLEKLFEYYETAFEKSGNALGCPIGNLSLELADTNERLRVRLEAAIKELVAGIESCLREAKQDLSIPADLDTADTARFIFHSFEGAILHMKVEKSIEPYQAFRRYLSGYLNNDKSANKINSA